VSTTAKAKFSVGVSVLVTNRSGKLLLGERQNTGTADGLLSTPGGRIEMDENMYQCAQREAKEEADITVLDLVMLGFQEHFRYGKHYFMFYYWAPGYTGKIKNVEPDKCKGWAWYDIEKIGLNECTEPFWIFGKVRELFRTRQLNKFSKQ
jgi:8-oxo-dGTP diphosphatase